MGDESMLIACTKCGAMNRLARERLVEQPNCGKCHQPLFNGKPVALGAADFDRHAQRSDLPLVIDFWAPWCGPCRSMAPQFEAAAAALEPAVRLGKVDTEAEPALGARFGIRSIPTLVLFAGGREIARQSGAAGTEQIIAWVRANLPES